MKSILKFLFFLFVGFTVGILIVVAVKALSGDGSSIGEIFRGMDFLETVGVFLAGVTAFYVAVILQVIVHEGGHLTAGWLTGYRFVSFRIFNLALIRQNGRFRLRQFGVSGTGGQCLMAPPQRPLDEIDTRWYNAGGVLANILVATIALLLFFCCAGLPAWLKFFLIILSVVGYFFALLNGIPLRLVHNDGHNMLYLERSPRNKRLVCQLLEANAMLQEGLTPDELPVEMFDDEPVDWSDSIQANWQLVVVARLLAEHRWEDVCSLTDNALADGRLLPILSDEFQLEKVFACLMTGRADEARTLYTPPLQRNVRQYMRMQSGKQRIQFAVDLLMNDEPDKALSLLERLKARRNQYPMQGEVTMDIGLMTYIYDKYKDSLPTPTFGCKKK